MNKFSNIPLKKSHIILIISSILFFFFLSLFNEIRPDIYQIKKTGSSDYEISQNKKSEFQFISISIYGETGAILINSKTHTSTCNILEYSLIQTQIKNITVTKWNKNFPQVFNDTISFIDTGKGRSPPET